MLLTACWTPSDERLSGEVRRAARGLRGLLSPHGARCAVEANPDFVDVAVRGSRPCAIERTLPGGKSVHHSGVVVESILVNEGLARADRRIEIIEQPTIEFVVNAVDADFLASFVDVGAHTPNAFLRSSASCGPGDLKRAVFRRDRWFESSQEEGAYRAYATDDR